MDNYDLIIKLNSIIQTLIALQELSLRYCLDAIDVDEYLYFPIMNLFDIVDQLEENG